MCDFFMFPPQTGTELEKLLMYVNIMLTAVINYIPYYS